MSVNIFHKTGSGTGTLQKVAGNTVILDANVSEIREGTWLISATTTNQQITQSITFSTPMPDADYIVVTQVERQATFDQLQVQVRNKTTTGFDLAVWFNNASGENEGHWYAFKPIPMDGYTELQNKVNNPDNMPTQNSNNLVKSGGVWEALKDAGTVFSGTRTEWENLSPSEQERYEVVCLTDDDESLVDRPVVTLCDFAETSHNYTQGTNFMATFTLPKGTWIVTAYLYTVFDWFGFDENQTESRKYCQMRTSTGTDAQEFQNASQLIRVTQDTTMYVKIYRYEAGSSQIWQGKIQGVKL